MSARRLPVVLSSQARRDVRGALLYTRRQWGEEQRHRFRHVIDRALDVLGANPDIGRPRDELFPGCRSYPVGQHLIFYRVDATGIAVSRLLHAHQDAAGEELEPPPLEPQE